MVWGWLLRQRKEGCDEVDVDVDVPQDQNKQQLLVDSHEVEVVSVHATITNVDGDIESHND